MQINRIFKNTFIGVLQNVFNILVSVFVNGYIAAKLGTDGYGKFIFAFAFPQIFSVIADFGLQGYYTKKIAHDREHTERLLGDMVIVRLGFSLLAVVAASTALVFTGHDEETKMAVMIGFLAVLIAQTFITNAWTVFQAHEEMQYVAVSNILSRVTVAILSVLIMHLGGALIAVTIVYGFGYLLQVFYCVRVLRQRGWRPVYSWRELAIGSLLREAWPFSLFGIFSFLAMSVDKTMLSLISGDAALGIYNAAASLTINSFMVSIAVANAIFPSLVKSFASGDFNNFSAKMEIILKWMVLLGAPLALLITFYGQEIILFIFSNDSYMASVPVLQMLIWLLPIDLIVRILRYALIAVNREHAVTKYYGLGLAINVLINLLLMPKFSYMGAAYAALVTQSFLLLSLAVLYFRTIKIRPRLPYIRLAIGNLLLFLALLQWSSQVFWMVGGCLGGVFFAGLMLLTRVVSKSEFDAVVMRGKG